MKLKVFFGVLLLGSTIRADLIFKNNIADELFPKSEMIEICNNPLNFKAINENFNVEFINGSTRLLDVCKQRDNSGETLLHIAASKGLTQLVRYLLERGFPPDVRTKDLYPNTSMHYRDTLQTPMHYAAAGGHVQVLALLAGHGADISALTESGDSPLHKAALHGQMAAARWLLDRGVDVDTENVFGASPLTMALVNQRKEMAELLVNRGAESLTSDLEVISITEILLLVECFLLMLKLSLN